MTNIINISCALPEYQYNKEDILTEAAGWLGVESAEFTLFRRFVGSAEVNTRRLAIPLKKVASLNGRRERADIFKREAALLAEKSINKSLTATGLRAEQIDALIFTSCTIPTIPAIDTTLISSLGFRSDIIRIPIYQHGCAGGIMGLSIANSLTSSAKNILLVSAELCSLVYQRNSSDAENLVGCAIFGDGSASALISPDDGGLQIISCKSHLIPNSTHLMGYYIRDDGTYLKLDKNLPKYVEENAQGLIVNFLRENGLTPNDIKWWLFHPGGKKVINSLEKVFALDSSQCHWAWDVLRECGNLSSSAVLFVASKFMQDKEFTRGDYALMFGLGPGLTIQLVLLKC